MQSCLMGAPQLAEWMKKHPADRLAAWRCVIGKQDGRGVRGDQPESETALYSARRKPQRCPAGRGDPRSGRCAAGRSRRCSMRARSASARSTAGCGTAPIRTPASARSTSLAMIRRRASLPMRRWPRCGKSWTRSATPARSALLWVTREYLAWCRRRTSRASPWIPVRRRVRRPSSSDGRSRAIPIWTPYRETGCRGFRSRRRKD